MTMADQINTIEDLYESIGGFGIFQVFALFSILYPELPAAFLGMIPVFVGDYPKSWACSQSDGLDDIISVNMTAGDICSCNGTWDGGDTTIVAEWNLVCEYSWVTDFITSVQMVGMLCGGFFGSQIADIFGRKRPMYIFCLVMITAAGASGFTNSPFVYAAARFFVGASISSYLIVGALYPMEFLTPRWRNVPGPCGPWGEGVMILSLIAYYIRPWRLLTWITALPMAITFLSFPFLPESPRWLLQKGKVSEAKKALDQIASWNGHGPVDENIVKKLAKTWDNENNNDSDSESREKVGCCQFLINPQLRGKMCIFSGAWFTVSFIYYGITFNTKNLSGNVYLNIAFQGLVDAVGFPTAAFALAWFGRRKAFTFYMTLASSALLGIVLMEIDVGVPYNETWVTGLSLAAKLCICGAWSSVKCFTAESFPTSIRSTAVGLATVAAGFGGVIAPQMAFLGSMYRPAPYFVFGAFAVGSTGLALLLKETRNRPLNENV